MRWTFSIIFYQMTSLLDDKIHLQYGFCHSTHLKNALFNAQVTDVALTPKGRKAERKQTVILCTLNFCARWTKPFPRSTLTSKSIVHVAPIITVGA